MKRSTLYSIGLVALLVTWSLAPWSPVLWTLATNHKAPSVQQSYKGLPQITPLESVTGDDAGDGQVATWNGQHWKGKTPGGSTAVTPPPAGYVEWLTADQGVTFGTSGGWTNTLLATWDASSTDLWSAGSPTCSKLSPDVGSHFTPVRRGWYVSHHADTALSPMVTPARLAICLS